MKRKHIARRYIDYLFLQCLFRQIQQEGKSFYTVQGYQLRLRSVGKPLEFPLDIPLQHIGFAWPWSEMRDNILYGADIQPRWTMNRLLERVEFASCNNLVWNNLFLLHKQRPKKSIIVSYIQFVKSNNFFKNVIVFQFLPFHHHK